MLALITVSGRQGLLQKGREGKDHLPGETGELGLKDVKKKTTGPRWSHLC